MRVDRFGEPPARRGRRVPSPSAKLVLAMSAIVLVLLGGPHAGWIRLVVAGVLACLFVAAGIPLRWIVARCLAALPFLALLALGIPASRGFADGWDLMWIVLARASLAFAILLLLTGTTRVDRLFKGLTDLGVPSLLVAILLLAVRYLAVLADEWATMERARAARSADAGIRGVWLARPMLIGSLFLRCLHRAESLHQAMLARGFTGPIRLLDDSGG